MNGVVSPAELHHRERWQMHLQLDGTREDGETEPSGKMALVLALAIVAHFLECDTGGA